MSGHVIRTFQAVDVGRIAVGHKFADEAFQVPADVGIGIFGNQQGGAGVAEKHMTQPDKSAALYYNVLQLLTDFVKASAGGGNFQVGGMA